MKLCKPCKPYNSSSGVNSITGEQKERNTTGTEPNVFFQTYEVFKTL
jgi:hypothetical protein